MRRFRYGTAAACAALLFLSGCGGGAATTDQSSVAPAAAMGTPQAAMGETSAIRAPEAARDSDGGTGKAADTANPASGVKVTLQDRQVIYTGSMTVRAKDVGAAVLQAKQAVTGVGGYLAKEESSSSDGGNASALLEFKIPPARYAELLVSLGKDLGKQLSLQQGTQDVTLQVADVNSRLKSAQQSLDSLRTLLKKADTIGQVLQVEREISGREADLESLQAQQKELATQVGMATLSLRLIGPAAVAKPRPSEEPAGFLGGLKSGWKALVSFAKVVLTVVGVLLPWLIVVVPLTVLALYLVRRSRARRPAPPAAPAEAQAS